MRKFSVLPLLALTVFLSTTGCRGNQLTREKAADLIRPEVSATMTLMLPTGQWNDFDAGYIKPLAGRGILRLYKKEMRFSAIIEGTREVDIAEPTELAKPFIVQQKPAFSDRSAPAIVLGNARFREVTGLKETDQAGKSVEVEFTWEWVPTPVGAALNGATIERFVDSPIRIDVSGYRVANAACALYDDGWRCELPRWQRNEHLNNR